MREKIVEIISAAVTDLNADLQYDTLENPSEDTALFGGEDGIDSLSLVHLVVDIEGRVHESLGQSVSLADEKAMSSRNSPYRSVGAMADFVTERLAG